MPLADEETSFETSLKSQSSKLWNNYKESQEERSQGEDDFQKRGKAHTED